MKHAPFLCFIESVLANENSVAKGVSQEMFLMKFEAILNCLDESQCAEKPKKVLLESKLNRMFFNILDDILLAEASFYYMKMLLTRAPTIIEKNVIFKSIDVQKTCSLPLINELLDQADFQSASCPASIFFQDCFEVMYKDEFTLRKILLAKNRSLGNALIIEKMYIKGEGLHSLVQAFKTNFLKLKSGTTSWQNNQNLNTSLKN